MTLLKLDLRKRKRYLMETLMIKSRGIQLTGPGYLQKVFKGVN